ncbi:MAG: patatin-like phospholipase family protein [Pseudomonadota bacterium]|jgi:predicted acylesterase/phospholipase RssA
MREVDVVVAGGGSNAVSLAAALYTIARRRKVCRVAGTSAGGLSALAFAYGVDETRLLRQFEGSLSGNRLLDGSVLGLARRYGWCKGDALRAAAAILVGGEHVRLGDAKIPVAVVAADLYERRPRVLSSWETPNVLAVDAAVATAAIPLVFQAQTIRGLDVGNRLHVDGGTVKNAAFDLFDDNARPTIGIRPRPSKTTATPVRSVGDYVKAMGSLLLWSADNAHESAKASGAVVDVDAEDGLDFDLSVEDVRRRWAAGVSAGEAFTRGAP